MTQPGSTPRQLHPLVLAAACALSALPLAAAEDDLLADPEKLYRDKLMDVETQRVLRLVPKFSSKVYEPPGDWQTLRFDSIELKLPLGTNWFVFHTNTHPNLLVLSAYNEQTNRFSLSTIGPYAEPGIPYPPVSYQDMHRVLHTVPDDLVGAESETDKREVVTRLLTKAVNKSESVREWMFVETASLKAMIHRTPPKRYGHGSIHVNVWNRTGTVYFYVMAAMETSPFMGQQILGGVQFHGDSISARQVQSDIAELLTRQPRPDSSKNAP